MAIQKHAEWKYKFRAAMSAHEPMDVDTISKDNCCEIRKWLHGDAKVKHGNLASYSKCVSAHAAFHHEAGKVADKINQKKNDEAEQMLASGTPYHEASKKVGVAIVELKIDIGQ
ncbi:MAG: CZB domain-containing protein [Terracidiphilus sp.]|jgi:hypothetical protein